MVHIYNGLYATEFVTLLQWVELYALSLYKYTYTAKPIYYVLPRLTSQKDKLQSEISSLEAEISQQESVIDNLKPSLDKLLEVS